MLNMINKFLQHKARPDSFGEGHIVLIAKAGVTRRNRAHTAEHVTKQRLQGGSYPFFLSRRLALALPEISSPHQTCSVPGRSIFSSLALRDLFTFTK